MKKNTVPLSAMFLGPKAENAMMWSQMFQDIFTDYVHWRRNYFPTDPAVLNRNRNRDNEQWAEEFNIQLQSTLDALKAHYPFYSPRYMAHMLSEQTLPAVLGYFSGMLYNPNNVTDEAAPVTVELELEFGKMLCKMLGYDNSSWAHICSGGTVANIEALWVARHVQFLPLVIQDFCIENNLAPMYEVKLPNNDRRVAFSRYMDIPTILSLRPNIAIGMLKHFLKYLVDVCGYNKKSAQTAFTEFIPTSKYSIKHQGLHNVLKAVDMNPVIFVPESAHYSFKKAINILGYGENSIRYIPLNNKFRIDVSKLEELLFNMKENEYIAAVVAVAGTTEEGAVDPIHEVKFLRDKLECERNRSFWLHVDAAWGGYVRTLFIDDNHKNISSEHSRNKLDNIAQSYIDNMNMVEIFEDSYRKVSTLDSSDTSEYFKVRFDWQDKEVIKAYVAMPSADSITIDPHKMGYIPYPAGAIAYKNSFVSQLVTQRANYISDEVDETWIDIDEIKEIGPYIIEGSKPGAMAIACWLATKTIPLDKSNHGKIIKTSILNTIKLKYYLVRHRKITFFTIEDELAVGLPEIPFMFAPLYDNIDTNVICFIVLPMVWERCNGHKSRMIPSEWKLESLNQLNKEIYKRFTIEDESNNQRIYGQKFFLSRTTLEKNLYSFDSIVGVLQKFNIPRDCYEKHGLFVLRSTIMNPWYYTAATNSPNKDYFMDFIRELHKVARSILNYSEFN